MVARYRRVAQTESPLEQDVKKKRADRIERITAKLHALIWIAASAALILYTNIFQMALTDPRVNRYVPRIAVNNPSKRILVYLSIMSSNPHRISLHAGVICFVANMGVVLYLTIWLPLIMKITVPWEIYCPHLIPISTTLGLLSVLLFMIAFWPVFGMLSPLIITILLMGFLFSTHFIPWPC